MTTGKKPAKEAGKELASKKSTAGQKTVAASDLSQSEESSAEEKEISLLASAECCSVISTADFARRVGGTFPKNT